MKFHTKRYLVMALFASFAFTTLTQPLNAGIFSRIKKLLKFEFFGKKKKPKEEAAETPLPDPGEQQPEPVHQAPPRIDIQQVVSDIQSLATEGPEIYTLLVNDSVGRLLDKAEQYLDNLKWGSRDELVEELTQRMIHQKPKASMLLQMNIWRTYIDSPMPLKNFIQDITRELEKLVEYQAAISQLVKNDWLRANQNLHSRVEKLLVKLDSSRKTLQSLDELMVDLLDIRTQSYDPIIFRFLDEKKFLDQAVGETLKTDDQTFQDDETIEVVSEEDSSEESEENQDPGEENSSNDI